MGHKELKWLTREEAAEYLRISIYTLNAWESNKVADKPTSYRVGRRYLYSKEDLDNFIRSSHDNTQ